MTDRASCQEDFLTRIRRIIAAKPDRLILRDKNISPTDYFLLGEKVTKYCDEAGIRCTLHFHTYHPADSIHLPMPVFRELSEVERSMYNEIGVSVHSVEEAIEAEKSGVAYIVFGHIFPTSCKPDIPPRGAAELRRVTEAVSIPVYAIGGINERNIAEIQASGACIMSSAMNCDDPEEYIRNLREKVRKNEIQT